MFKHPVYHKFLLAVVLLSPLDVAAQDAVPATSVAELATTQAPAPFSAPTLESSSVATVEETNAVPSAYPSDQETVESIYQAITSTAPPPQQESIPQGYETAPAIHPHGNGDSTSTTTEPDSNYRAPGDEEKAGLSTTSPTSPPPKANAIPTAAASASAVVVDQSNDPKMGDTVPGSAIPPQTTPRPTEASKGSQQQGQDASSEISGASRAAAAPTPSDSMPSPLQSGVPAASNLPSRGAVASDTGSAGAVATGTNAADGTASGGADATGTSAAGPGTDPKNSALDTGSGAVSGSATSSEPAEFTGSANTIELDHRPILGLLGLAMALV